MRPPTNYYGSKSRLARTITSLMPEHRTYVEPFAGSAAVFFAKVPSPTEVLNDLDGHIVTFFEVLRDQPDELVRVLELTPYSRAEYERCAAALHEDAPPLERARRWWTVTNQSMHRGHGRGGSGWAASANTGHGDHPGKLAGLRGRLHACAERLAGVYLEHRPAAEVIEKFCRRDDVVVYADPPYLLTARADQDRRGYQQEMTSADDHRGLAEALRAVPGPVILSGYPSELYDEELYPDWHRLEISVDVPSAGRCRTRVATEVLWSNRPLGGQLALVV